MEEQQRIPEDEYAAALRAAINGDELFLREFFRRYCDYSDLKDRVGDSWFKTENSDEENARRMIFHTNQFNNWAEYQEFRNELNSENSNIAFFERAADAIVNGEINLLQIILNDNPALIRMRSPRTHHSTLLNYVGANGFEGYRQKTPKNAVEVAEVLLDAGAEIDAMGDMYRGTTTLGLVATSVHPVITGVQQELMDILIRHGADVNHAVAPDYTEGMLILACLANGRGEPVQYLARHGATLDLEGAGGVGDIEKIKSYYNSDGNLIDASFAGKRDKAFIWACLYDRKNVFDYFLGHGIDPATKADGMPALHCAIHGGNIEIVKTLIQKGAPLETLNVHGGTALGGALWSAYNAPKPAHLEIIEMLIMAGALVKEEWWKYVDELRANKKV
jgi:ankyrin repeat protein